MRKGLHAGVLLSVLFTFSVSSGAEPVRVDLVSAPASKIEIGSDEPAPAGGRIGEPVPLIVRIEAPAGTRLGALEVATASSDFALIVSTDGPSLPADAPGGVIEIPVAVVPFQVGDVEFPGIRVPWVDGDGQTGEAVSEPWPLSVTATVENPAEAEPADIRGPVDLPVPWPRWWIPAALAGIALLAGVIWWMLRRPTRPEAVTLAPPVDPFDGLAPDAWALRALEQLVRDDVLGRQGTGIHHDRLTEIVRRYIEGRYGVDTFEHTTSEILSILEHGVRAEPGPRATLKVVLEQSDLVKFARLEPAAEESRRLVDVARRYVEETRSLPAAVSNETAEEAQAESA